MVTGIPTGIDAYDRLTLGLHSGELTVIGARPGDGKTALGGCIARAVARAGFGAMFFSLEMSRVEILYRVLSAESRIEGLLLRTGLLSQTHWSALSNASVTTSKMPLWIDDRSGLTIHDIANASLGAIDETRAAAPLGVIVVDYLQKIAVPRSDSKKGRYEQVGDFAKGLKRLAKDTKLPVIALAQLRRLGKTEKGKRPTMDDLRESGDIEQESDVVTLIHHDPAEKGVAQLSVEKARSGRPGIVRVKWRPEFTSFENLAEGTDEASRWR
jgi:replicative DNA helicase